VSGKASPFGMPEEREIGGKFRHLDMPDVRLAV
jgi:hypothetical protein